MQPNDTRNQETGDGLNEITMEVALRGDQTYQISTRTHRDPSTIPEKQLRQLAHKSIEDEVGERVGALEIRIKDWGRS